MADVPVPAVRDALNRVREMADVVFDALLEPYVPLASSDPDSVLGDPVTVPGYAPTDAVRAVVAEAARNGKESWALEQIEERQQQIKELLRDYRGGRYRETRAADWIGRVRRFRETIHGDLNTAMQAPRGWDRLDLRERSAGEGSGLDAESLSSKDVAAQIGLAERTVRRRIKDGRLGPWQKQGSRWVISRKAFLAFWADRLLETDSDLPRPPEELHDASEVEARIVHMPLRPDA